MKYLGVFVVLCFLFPATIGTALAACTAPAGSAGDMVYNSDQKIFQYCNDTAWIALNQPGTGSGGCANPTLAEGQIVYNGDGRMMQGCAGSIHRALGPRGGKKWDALAVGFNSDQGCALRDDGTAWCWGDDGSQELGNGGALTADQHSPTEVVSTGVSGTAWIWLDMEVSHACGIRDNGTGYCWGSDSSGKLGNGSGDTTSKSTPIAMTMTGVTGTAWTDLLTGQDNTCGIRNDGTGYCWGDDANGQVGNGTATTGTAHEPKPVSLTGVTGAAWTLMSGGWRHHCGIRDNGTGYCWGNDADGKLGNGATGSGTAPSPINVAAVTGTAWTYLSAAQNHSCGIRDNGSGWCWGNDTNGELGNGAAVTADQTSPSAIDLTGVSGSTWISIEAGVDHSCGVRDNGTGYCWGDDTNGELGNGAVYGDQVSPYPVTTTGLSGAGWTRIIASGLHSCGLRDDGAISCWGHDGAGRSANGPEGGNRTSAVSVAGGAVWKTIEAGLDHSCGLKTDDTAWCWGDDTTGELGNGATTGEQNIPSAVTGGHLWKKIDSGSGISCGVKSDDTAWCWGNDTNGQLGDGVATTGSPDPVLVSGGSTWKTIDTGGGHTCGVKSDDSLWCWGNDGNGQIGNGATTGNQVDPNVVTGGYSWKAVSTGSVHTCGIQADNTLWCWGSDGSGQIGNGATTGNQPDPVYIMDDIASVRASGAHSCALDVNDDLWCWGAASNGRLGNGTTTPNQAAPVLIAGGPWVSLHTGLNSHSCAIKADGSLWCWGLNTSGQLGDGTLTARSSPTQMAGAGTWLSVSAGSTHSCGLIGGEIPAKALCWGSAGNGEIGNGEFSYSLAPESIYCGGPEGRPGAITYNTDENILQYCDGTGWVGLGRHPNACDGTQAAGTACKSGTIYAGLSPDGNVPMFTTPADAGQLPWNNGSGTYTTTGIADSTTGEANTTALAALAAGDFPYQAAVLCNDLTAYGYSDWYLPSESELGVVYANRAAIGGFVSGQYWSSTESANHAADIYNFDGSGWNAATKNGFLNIRCVRK